MIADRTGSPGWFRTGGRVANSPQTRGDSGFVVPGVTVDERIRPDQETRLSTDPSCGFSVEDITVGAFAHGFGTTADGQSFAFRTVRATLTLEIYRTDAAAQVPGPEDVIAVAHTRVTDVDMDDERSVVALVHDLIPDAVPVHPADPGARREPTTVRALLLRLSAVLDSM